MMGAYTLTLEAEQEMVLPPFVGWANYAEALQWLRQVDQQLAQIVHDGNGPKPITCSSLMDVPLGRRSILLKAGQRVRVRMTTLHADVTQVVNSALQEQPPQQWRIGRQSLRVVAVTCDPAIDPTTGLASYEEIAEGWLLADSTIAPEISMTLASPTTFHSRGVQVPLPMPNLLLGSLADRWNAFSPIPLEPIVREYVESAVGVSYCRLQSMAVSQKRGNVIIGCMGDVTYRSLRHDHYWLAVFQMLCDFALYSGVGISTTAGLGQCLRRRRTSSHDHQE